MEFNYNSNKIIKYLLPYFDSLKFNKQPINYNKENNIFLIFASLLNDLNEANKFIKSLKNKLQYKINNINEIKLHLNDSKYFPEIIKNYIYTNGKKFLTYTISLNEKIYNLHFMLFDNIENLQLYKYHERAFLVFTWLYICNKYSQNCNNFLNIYIYLTPFKKIIPQSNNVILSSQHINSAFTYACIENGEIVIFRDEEWFKVFIHETIHSFGFDYTLLNDTNIINYIKNIYPINSEFSIADAYTETMARIINSAIYAFNIVKNDKKFNNDNYYLYLTFLLNIERHYALHQLDNILNFMNLSYENLYLNTKKSKILRNKFYKEKTHVFSYYILSCVLLNNYRDFCIFANKYNNFYKFDNSLQNKNEFLKLINENYKSPILLEDLKTIKKLKKTSLYKNNNEPLKNKLRMSVIEI